MRSSIVASFCVLLLCSCRPDARNQNTGREDPLEPAASPRAPHDPTGDDHASDGSVRTAQHSLEQDGLRRRYFVTVPESHPGEKLPVVMVLHGGGGNAQQAMSSMNLDDLATRRGAILVFPEGTGRAVAGKLFATWNAGECCGSARKENVDDVGFLAAVLEDVGKRYPADRSRVFLTGHSNGAMMTYRMACERSELITAIAPIGGQPAMASCRPARFVPTLHIHGDADRCARYEGGQCGGCFSDFVGIRAKDDTWPCMAVPEAVTGWAMLQGCAKQSTTSSRSGATCTSFSLCPGDGEVSLCTLPKAGHAFPGGSDPPFCERNPDGLVCERWQGVVGPPAPQFPTAEVLWDFFSKQRR